MKYFYVTLIFIVSCYSSQAQVGIGTTSPNAQLDIKSSNQATPANTDGILIPKVDAFPTNAPTSSQDGMMVYLTTTVGANPPGFYYWDNASTSWKGVGGDKGWGLNGTSGTTPIVNTIAASNENFVGTSDAKDLVIGANKYESIRVKSGIDKVGLFNNSPDYNLDIKTNVTGVILPRNGIRIKDVTLGSGTQKGSFFGFDYNNLNETLIWTYGSDENNYTNKSIRLGVGNDSFNRSIAKFMYRSIGTFNESPNYALDIKTAPNDAIYHPTGRNGIRINTPSSNSSTNYAGLFMGIKENGTAQDVNEGYLWNYGDGVATNSFLSFGLGNDTTTGEIMRLYKTNVGIGTTSPTTGAILDVNSTNSGVLLPRVSLINVNTNWPIFIVTKSLLVYNTNAAVTGGNGEGFYYWDGFKWVKLQADSNDKWNITGNSGTNPAINFIGTTDDNDLIFRRFNNKAGQIGTTNTSFGLFSAPSITGGYNTAFGATAMNLATTGNYNSAFGSGALYYNTGDFNTAIGTSSLFNNHSGTNNVGLGVSSLYNNISGSNNIAIGKEALLYNSSGSDKIAIGFNALYSSDSNIGNIAIGTRSQYWNSSSNYNTSVGYQSLWNLNTGEGNSAFGYSALEAGNTGYYNTAIGYESLRMTRSDRNTAVGYGTMSFCMNCGNNTAIGFESQYNNTNNNNNVSVGSQSLYSNSDGNYLTAIGTNAMKQNQNGMYNTAVGFESLNTNQSSSNNTAVGYHSLFAQMNGDGNSAFGYNAMSAADLGMYSTATGYQALFFNHNNCNTANGYNSMFSNNLGGGNTAMGYQSLFSNISGYYNVAIGFGASNFSGDNSGTTALGAYSLYNNAATDGNTATGYESMRLNTYGNFNTANGYQALKNQTLGNNNSAFGFNAMSDGNGGVGNTATGYQSLKFNSGNNNTASGYNSLYNNLYGNNNTAFGYLSQFYNTNGSYNTAFGDETLYNNSSGTSLTAVGTLALYSNISGNENSAVGTNALRANVSGSYNSALGFKALELQTVSSGNSGFGYFALNSSDGSYYNTASGYYSLKNCYGNYNTASGYNSLNAIGIGSNNTAMGSNSLNSNTGGSSNTAIGAQSLFNHYSGDYNTAIGNNAMSTLTSGSNNIAIGNNAQVAVTTSDNQLSIGNVISGINMGSNLNGKIGIGNMFPTEKLDIIGRIKMSDGNEAAGKVLTSDATGVATWQPLPSVSSYWTRNNATSQLYTSTLTDNIGIGTTTPNAPLQFSNAIVNRKIVLYDSNNNDNQYYGFGINGGTLRYQTDSTGADHVFFAGVNSTSSNELVRIKGTGNVGIGTNNPGTKLEINGYTKLGSDAPAIRVIKLTGTTSASQNGTVVIAHGLNSAKILSATVLVEYATSSFVPASYSRTGYEFDFYLSSGNIYIWNSAANSGSILSKPLKVMITYEE